MATASENKIVAEFPRLWDIALTGKCKVWEIRVEETVDGKGLIRTEYGYEDGKKTVNEKVVLEGKNKGKKNETTAVQQAIVEARAVWSKKKDAGYKESANGAGAVDGVAGAGAVGGAGAVSGGAGAGAGAGIAESRAKAISVDVPLPMLAHDYHKRGKDITFPCFVQPKFDGTRCVAVCGPGGGLYSRNRKVYPNLEHIKAVIRAMPAGVILDGELYSDELTFQEIVGLVKSETLKKGQEEKMGKVGLWVYDVVDAEKGFGDRWRLLNELAVRGGFGGKGSPLRLVETMACGTAAEVKGFHDRFVGEGYEGCMLRNARGKYAVGHRCKELQKYKEFEDAEFTVVGFVEGDGVEKGCVIWVCKTGDGKEFRCRPRGTHEERRSLLMAGGSYVGKKLTVRYQELTDEGLPRFPVGVAFRDYE
jgi:ATP-dependent DNA ligase